MRSTLRIVTILMARAFALHGVAWLVVPDRAAASLGMPSSMAWRRRVLNSGNAGHGPRSSYFTCKLKNHTRFPSSSSGEIRRCMTRITHGRTQTTAGFCGARSSLVCPQGRGALALRRRSVPLAARRGELGRRAPFRSSSPPAVPVACR